MKFNTPLRWLRHLCLAALLLIGLLYWASRTPSLALPAGIGKETQHLTLAGYSVAVTLYYPANREAAPLVVVAHGFTRSKRYMAGWGIALARQGFIAAVPTQPTLMNHKLNAQALAELLHHLRDPKAQLEVKPNGQAAFLGFSMGGLTTLLAAEKTPVDAWVGLDPVDMNGTGQIAAKQLRIPCAVLRAEPSASNMQGNARAIFEQLAGKKITLKVREATHLDPESPSDYLGQWVCGFVDAERHAIFEKYIVAFLKATLLSDTEAQRLLDAAAHDAALTEVVSSQPFLQGEAGAKLE